MQTYHPWPNIQSSPRPFLIQGLSQKGTFARFRFRIPSLSSTALTFLLPSSNPRIWGLCPVYNRNSPDASAIWRVLYWPPGLNELLMSAQQIARSFPPSVGCSEEAERVAGDLAFFLGKIVLQGQGYGFSPV